MKEVHFHNLGNFEKIIFYKDTVSYKSNIKPLKTININTVIHIKLVNNAFEF